MDIDWLRDYCMSLPHTIETVQWGDDLVFKIGGKMYAVVALVPSDHWMSFKCTDEEFAELTEQRGIIPVPYLARAKWVALETKDALPRKEIKRLVRQAYDLVYTKLPAKLRSQLALAPR